MNENKKTEFKIYGTHCASCEVVLERALKKIPGVEHATVNHATGKTVIRCAQQTPSQTEIEQVIKPHGYSLSPVLNNKNTKRDYQEIGAVGIIMIALYLLLQRFELIPNIGVTDGMSYGFIFVLGLVAAVSTCMAVTGGLIMAVAGSYARQHPNLTPRQKFKPHIYFNLGRLVSYALLGAGIGALGSILTLSSFANGVISIVASMAMIILGLQMLNLAPWLKRLQPKMPKFLAHKIHDGQGSTKPWAPFLLGAGTFFLPCGFTQALQLYVLAKGDAFTGGLTMFLFALGTLPALLSLGLASSWMKGSAQRYITKFAGVLVLILGLWNINNGLTLTGFSSLFTAPKNRAALAAAADPNVQIKNGRQVVRMRVNGLQYYPARFTVQAGLPVEWQIDGTGAGGCAQILTSPKLNLVTQLPRQGTKTITFTPTQPGFIPFSCSMGMTTPGAGFVVVTAAAPSITPPPCDSTIMNCSKNS